jgi:hypothetical protein
MENPTLAESRSREGHNILGIAVGSIWYGSEGSQIVNPVKMRFLCGWIHASKEQVDCVGAS